MMFKKFYVQITVLFTLLAAAFFVLIFYYLNVVDDIRHDTAEILATSAQALSIGDFRSQTVEFSVAFNDKLAKVTGLSFAFLILGLIFISGVLFNIIPLFIVSINNILSGITKFKDGDRLARIQLRSESEFGIIASYLNETFQKIDEYETEIEELISLTSHQLKSPITVSRAALEIVLDNTSKNLNDEQIKLITTVFQTQSEMARMIEDLLDVSKLHKNEIQFAQDRLDPLEQVHTAIAKLGNYAQKELFTVSIDESAKGQAIIADTFRFGQVLQNLLDNAIKYSSEPAHVAVAITSTATTLRIAVKDNGIGIPLEAQAHIFKRFFRAQNARSFKQGSGLGLYIVKTMVEKMNGTISFESVQGAGTTFFVEFPTA